MQVLKFSILILFSSIILNSGCCLNTCKNGSIENPKRVPKLNPPIVLKTLHVWRDGGSLGFIINDHMGANISFMIDGRIGSKTKGHVFFNTTHNNRTKGIMLPLYGKEECQLMGYLSSWLYSDYNKKELEKLEIYPDFKNISEKDFKAFHVYKLLKNRQKMKLKINK